jgi:hypothetical protein
VNQQQLIARLIQKLTSDGDVLRYAQNIATAVVSGPSNHCAATLSALLVFVGIYPNGAGTGSGDLEPWVPSLAYDLEQRRNWTKIATTDVFNSGDVGVVIVDSNTHHIYLVIDASDQTMPLVADNRETSIHRRAVAGDLVSGWSPTTYFLRPPSS